MIGQTRLNLTERRQLERPEIDDIKVRVHRLETQELPVRGYPFGWTVSQSSFTIPTNQSMVLPRLEIASGHVVTLEGTAVLMLIG